MIPVKKVKKNVKKKFFDVAVGMTAVGIQLYAGSEEELVGRTVVLDLTRSLRGKSLLLYLKIKLEDGKLVGEPFKVSLAGSYIRRIVRRGGDYVEDSFVAECNGSIVRIKPFLITRKRVSRAVRNALRLEAKKYLENYLKSRKIGEVFIDVMANKVQKEISNRLKKIYPLSASEIRWIEEVKEEGVREMNEEINIVEKDQEGSGEVGVSIDETKGGDGQVSEGSDVKEEKKEVEEVGEVKEEKVEKKVVKKTEKK